MRNTKVALSLVVTFGVAMLIVSDVSGDERVRSSKGSGNLYEKLIVNRSDAFYVKEPSMGAERLPTPAFSIYWRLKTQTPGNEQDGYYRMGGPDGKELGWIKREFVTSWNTRFCLDPTLPQPDRHFTVFEDPRGEQPAIKFTGQAGRVPEGHKRFALITDPSADDAEDALQKVAVFTGLVEAGGARQKEQMALYNLELEVVFVIDTTSSMEPLIEIAREVTKRTAQALVAMPQIEPVVHLGLVEYRDPPPEAEFAARVACRLDEGHSVFWKVLSKLAVSQKGDNDIPEDVIAGLQEAINKAGWKPNSSKHIILLGDAPAKDGFDPVIGESQHSSSGLSLDDVSKLARPQGGSDAARALSAINFHALCNNHPDPAGVLPAETRKVLDDPEFVKAIENATEEEIAEVFECSLEEAREVRLDIVRRKYCLEWQKRAETQFSTIASNRGEFEGYYLALNTHTSPTGKDSAVKGLTDTLNAAYQSLADAREGKDPDSSTAMTSGGSIGRAIYQIVSTRADAGRFAKEDVVTGYARTRDANGRLIAHQRVMVFKDELMHLYSQFDSLYTRFKNRSSKADRQNVADILNDLKEAVASQAAGQEFDENTDLRKIITFDFPLKTPALDTSAREIAVMTTPAFNNWLESLATARDRAKTLVLGGKTEWTTLANELEQEFSFLLLSELP